MPPKKATQPVQKNKPTISKKTPVLNKGGKTATTGKVPAKAAPKNETKKQVKKEVVGTKPNKETLAAIVMQRCIRNYLRKCRAIHARNKKAAYEAEMDRLEKEAYVQLAKTEQAEIEREYQKKEAEAKSKREQKRRIKRMLESSFDGEIDDIEKIFSEITKMDDDNQIEREGHGETLRQRHLLEIVECEDANGNTPVSEAASGGDVNTITLLLGMGADPNTVGHFRRTPLYRAAFAGHHEACQVLLEAGADPRLTAEDNQTPFEVLRQLLETIFHFSEVGCREDVKKVLSDWPVEDTDRLLLAVQTLKDKRTELNKSRIANDNNKQEVVIQECENNYKVSQKQLCKARQEYEKRITEHDLAVAEGYAKPENTIQAIQDAELHLALVEVDVSKTLDLLQQAKLKYREQKYEQNKEEGGEDDFCGITINIRELDDVLMRDIGDKIKSSKRCPLLIDMSGQSSVFLRYRDTNYLNVLQNRNMKPDVVRKALLGAVRYGKYMVLDTMDVNMFAVYSEVFESISPGLLKSIFDRSFIVQRIYLQLIRAEDGEEYNKNNFNDENASKFNLVFLTTNPWPEPALMESCYQIKVVVSK